MPGYRVPSSDLAVINPKFICRLCGLILRDADQTGCGHLFCHTCLLNKRRNRNPAVCVLGCGKILEQTQCFPDECVRRDILNLNVSCLNKVSGCPWRGTLRKADDHQSSCRYRPLPCGNDGCTIVVPEYHLVFHEQKECHHRREVCQHCHSSATVESLQDHLKICDDVPVSCEKCGKENIPQGQLNLHMDPFKGDCDCDRDCPFRAHGCSCVELMGKEALKRHLVESFNSHLLVLLHLLKHGRHQSRVEAPPEGSVREELRTAEAEIEAHTWALSIHYKKLEDLDSEVKALVGALVGVVDGLEEVSNTAQVSNAVQLQEIAALKDRVECLEANVQRQDATINVLTQLIGALFCLPQRSTGDRFPGN